MSTTAKLPEPTLVLPAGLERPLLAVFAALSSTVSLKIVGIQWLEVLEFSLLFFVLVRFARRSWRLTVSRAVFRLALGYTAFLLLALVGAALSFTRGFYLDTVGLYRPGYITLARASELFAGVSTLLILTEVFRRDREICIFTMKIFFSVGTFSAVASLVGLALGRVYIAFPTAASGRAAGFYGEGGPYGLYMLAVILSGWVLYPRLSGQQKQLAAVAQVFNVLLFFASASKAGVVAAALLFLVQLVLSSGWRQRAVTAAVAGVAIAIFIHFTNTYIDTIRYIAGGQTYEVFSRFRPNDINFVIGRVAGLYFVPRMIQAHPFTGVGWGNYGLVRNAVEYRGSSPVIGVTDQPGLGLYSTTAEIGIPLMLLLLYLLFRPVQLTRHLTQSRALVTLALVQPMVHLCGGQLNLTYPWIVTAFALGMAGAPESRRVLMRSRAKQIQQRPAMLPGTAEINPL